MKAAATTLLIAGALATLVPATASAAVSCTAPAEGDWQEAAPAAAGMDGERLAAAIDYGVQNGAAAIRVYRNGCRVGVDDAYEANRETRFES